MSTEEHFNELTPAQDERLTLFQEECLEVGTTICKIQRHGYESFDPRKVEETNRQALERECGDLLFALRRMVHSLDVDLRNFVDVDRVAKCRPYLHHQLEDPRDENPDLAAFDRAIWSAVDTRNSPLSELLNAVKAVVSAFTDLPQEQYLPAVLSLRLHKLANAIPAEWRPVR